MKILLLIFTLLISVNSHAELIINEVLSNEPGSATSLEWIELYNNSDSTLMLTNFTFVINNDTILFSTEYIEPFSYLLICKNLTSFESYWGDGSKIWGDSQFELSITEPIERSFSLRNSSDTINLYHENVEVSSFHWNEPGKDGVSWERKDTDSFNIAQSISKIGSTPGYINSTTLVQKDIALDSLFVVMDDFNPTYTFTISNRGLAEISNASITIRESAQKFLILSIQLPTIPSDSTIQFMVTFPIIIDSDYYPLYAYVSTSLDMRASNDSLEFMGVSNQYPPLVISEFLANPKKPKNTEWVEIYNRSLEPIDLRNWLIGDASKIYQISSTGFIIQPNQYVLLVDSEIEFYNEFANYDKILIEPTGWAILNNESDNIRLFDNYNILADNYAYDIVYDENYTIARDVESGLYEWGRSAEMYGTPGYKNELFETNHMDVKISLSSKYISPNDDGYEDNVIIDIDVPFSKNYTMKLYDTDGTIVRTFFSEKAYIPNQFVWDGSADDNSKLLIGIYILYLTTEDGLSAKETIVIAR